MSTDTSFDSVIPIPLFICILSTRRPPPPDTIRDPGLVDVVLRVCDRLCVCLRNWMAAEVGTRPSALGGGGDPGQNDMGSPGRRPFLPGPMLLTTLHLITLQWFDWPGRA